MWKWSAKLLIIWKKVFRQIGPKPSGKGANLQYKETNFPFSTLTFSPMVFIFWVCWFCRKKRLLQKKLLLLNICRYFPPLLRSTYRMLLRASCVYGSLFTSVKRLKSSISACSQISTFQKKKIIIIVKKIIVFHAGGRGSSKIFYAARLRPISNPLPFYIPFWTEKVPIIHIPSIDKWYPFNILI